MTQFICPYCFNKINSYEPSWIGKLFGARSSVQDECPNSACGKKFPRGITSLSNVLIAIVGDKDSGKSNYIAVLIYRIKELYRKFGWSLIAMDDETDKLYNRVFYAPLYGEDGIAYAVKATLSAVANQDVSRPLLYTLGMSNGKKYKVITLAFFDTAGEDLRTKNDTDTDESIKLLYRYIHNASGIIMLIDPTGIGGLRTRAGLARTTAANADEMRTIFERITRIIQDEKYQLRGAKIDIPFAITLSKIDLFRSVLKHTRIFQSPEREEGYIDLSEIDKNSGEIASCISDNDPIILQAVESFTNVRFFGVSALGEDPQKIPGMDAKKLVESTRPFPIRVEDPFLWLLYKNDFIKGK